MGGGAMRTAAKAAAFAGYLPNAARRAAALPTGATATTVHVAIEGESSPLVSSISWEKASGQPAIVQRPAWEIDDWEFAGGKEDEEDVVAAVAAAVSDRMLDQAPRLVFGPPPTLEEAKEATADLKEAMENVFFSPGAVEKPIKHVGESTEILPSVPKHVGQAFSLLQGSSEAQSIVASLACDKNVWDAVMKNDKVMEFCNKNQSAFVSDCAQPEESTGEDESLRGSSETLELTDKEAYEDSTFLADIVQNIKVKVSNMVSNISDFLQDFVGASSESHTMTTKTSTSSSDDYSNAALGASFIALAVATIIVVLVKRA